MNPHQFQTLLSVIKGDTVDPLPTAFLVDHPWIPKWAGITIKEYFDDDDKWLDANFKVVRSFPDTMFLPGFWSEYGMCTDPSAFGSKCIWHDNDSPFAEKVITDPAQVADLKKPDVTRDGLLPRVIRRLKNCEERIKAEGHEIKFAAARGPLNIASFLMGSTEFLMAIPMNPDEMKQLLEIITEFTIDWLRLQKESFPSIDGILILDDITGFIGEEDFKKFNLPFLKRIFNSFDAQVRFFHNDAHGLVCAPYLEEAGVNLFNFSSDHGIPEMQEATRGRVVLLGNVPPRDVLANGTEKEVEDAVTKAVASTKDRTRFIPSVGGGVPPDVSTENMQAFLRACGHGSAALG